MFQKVMNVLTHGGQMNLLKDEGGFWQYLMKGAELAAPFLGKLFGGGAPERADFGQETLDVATMLRDALTQGQDLRGDMVTDSQALKDIDIHNARSAGAFDPTTLGPGFEFLQPTVDQYSDVDFAANPLREYIQRQMGITQLAQQIGSQAPSMELGLQQLLGEGGQQAGAGWGGAVGNMLGILGNQMSLGDWTGGPTVGAQPATDPTGSIGTLPGPMAQKFESVSPYMLQQAPQMSPMIQSLIMNAANSGKVGR